MFTDPPLIAVVPLTVTEVSATPAPTVPVNTAFPVIPSVTLAPLPSVPENVTTLPVSTVAAPSVAFPV